VPGGQKWSTGAKKFLKGTNTPLLPPTFRAFGFRTFAVCQYNYRMCWCYSISSAQKVYQ